MHYNKMNNGGEGAVLMHNARALEHHANENIDPERTHLNMNLTFMQNPDDSRTDWQRFKDRLGQLSYRKQKNNVRMCSIIITAPKNIRPADVDKFFLVAHKELNALTGGTDNEVSAWVHKDETTPHMHYCFVPGVTVNGVPKLSASKMVDRQFLQKLHPRMQQVINKAFGHNEYKVVADDPADRAKHSDSLQTYKALMQRVDDAKDSLAQVHNEIDSSNDRLENINKAVHEYSDKYERLKESAGIVESRRRKLLADNSELKKSNDELDSRNSELCSRNDELENCIQHLKDSAHRLGSTVKEKRGVIDSLDKDIKNMEVALQAVRDNLQAERDNLQAMRDNNPDYEHLRAYMLITGKCHPDWAPEWFNAIECYLRQNNIDSVRNFRDLPDNLTKDDIYNAAYGPDQGYEQDYDSEELEPDWEPEL